MTRDSKYPTNAHPGDFDWVFDRWVAWVAWGGIAVALLMPEGGIPFGFCAVHETFRLPCPTCGMTRSVSHFLHGRLVESWRYHPMGGMVAVGMMATAVASLAPFVWKQRARGFLRRHRRAAWWTLWTLFLAWLVFGVLRMVWVATGGVAWP